jgi:hypothetical protein
VTLTLTFRSLSISESQFSGVKPSYGARATAVCHIPKIDEIPVSHLTQMENCQKVTLIRQSHLTNHLAAENGFMLLL